VGYAKIPNLYKDQRILLLRECYALEKIHGTSAHVNWNLGMATLHPGGENYKRFEALFDAKTMYEAFQQLGHGQVTVFGEAYGGKQQRQAWRYGPDLRFVVFEVRIHDVWLSVPDAEDVANKLGLQFVHYERVSTDIKDLDAMRDAPSVQAKRNGVEGDQPREGVVLRPLVELVGSNGSRILCKHKRDEERETRQPRVVGANLKVLEEAGSIALEWVTDTRMQHVLDKLPRGIGVESTGDVIRAMTEDIRVEGAGEFVASREARKAIGQRTAALFKKHLQESNHEDA
jgi:hypothetical protein